MTVAAALPAHEAFASVSCVEPACEYEAEAHSDRCRHHLRTRKPDKRTARWTPDAIIEAIRAHAAAHGHPPTSTDWIAGAADHPSSSLVKKVFGSWADAIVDAGFARPVRGVSAKKRPPGAAVEEREPKAEESDTARVSVTAEATGRKPSRSSTVDACFAVALIVGLRELADALEASLSPSRNGFSDLSGPRA